MKSFARPLAVCTVVALSLGSVVVTASAASAASGAADIETIDSLLAAGQDVALSADVTASGTSLDLLVGGSAVIDLNGHDLTVQGGNTLPGIQVPNGAHLTIKDSLGGGVLSSTGGEQSAGIGSALGADVDSSNPGLVEIQSGTVVANAGIWFGAAGIGGSGWSGGPAVSISGGTVTATGGEAGAGIGSGYNRAAAAISISGGTVTAVAGSGASAIGGPRQGSNTSTTISGGTVTVHGSDASVFGAGLDSGDSSYVFGTVAITGGTVIIPEDSFLEIPTGKVVSNAGVIDNRGVIGGEGAVANSGSIIGSGTVQLPVSGHNYIVSYNPINGSVDAASVAIRSGSFFDAGRSLPQPTHPSLPFTGWITALDGTGTRIEPTTDLTNVFAPAVYEPIAVTLYATYGPAPEIIDASFDQAVRGRDFIGKFAVNGGDQLSFKIIAGALPDGLSLDRWTGLITGTPTTAGTFDFSVLVNNEGGADRHAYSLTVQREPKVLTLVAPSAPAAVGTKVAMKVSGLDAGEPFAILGDSKVLATGTANAQGKATPLVTMPKIPDATLALILVGSNETRSGTGAVNVVAAKKAFSVTTNKKSYHYGQKATITVKKLAPGEKVSITFRGKTVTSAKAVASSKGTYVIKVSVGSSKGTKTITVTGASKTRAGLTKVKISK